jgi:hypothetical protein
MMSLGKNKIIGVGMVLSGSVHEYDGFREPDRLVQLMADAAMRRGVPTPAILLELRSINTPGTNGFCGYAGWCNVCYEIIYEFSGS